MIYYALLMLLLVRLRKKSPLCFAHIPTYIYIFIQREREGEREEHITDIYIYNIHIHRLSYIPVAAITVTGEGEYIAPCRIATGPTAAGFDSWWDAPPDHSAAR